MNDHLLRVIIFSGQTTTARIENCGSLQRSGYNGVLAEEAIQCGGSSLQQQQHRSGFDNN
jgi:hypothetical protein